MEDEFESCGITYSPDNRLKKCPFCGGEAWLEHIPFPDGDVWYTPQCSECSCGWNRNYETKEDAIEDWNKRLDKISDL